ncbi:Nn.00g009810.m01.CDS01 [Neocucurbitaria sp. VM-36]
MQKKEMENFEKEWRNLDTISRAGLLEIASLVSNATWLNRQLDQLHWTTSALHPTGEQQHDMICDHAESIIACLIDMYHFTDRLDGNLVTMYEKLGLLKYNMYLLASSIGPEWRAFVVSRSTKKCLQSHRTLHECESQELIKILHGWVQELNDFMQFVNEYYQHIGDMKKDMVSTCKRFQIVQFKGQLHCATKQMCPAVKQDGGIYISARLTPVKDPVRRSPVGHLSFSGGTARSMVGSDMHTLIGSVRM